MKVRSDTKFISICLHILLTLTPILLFSSNQGFYQHQMWDRERGFPGGSVEALAHDANGYLWIGTDLGLVRFDGLKFEFFKCKKKSILITGVLRDRQGTLWITGFDGLFRFLNGEIEAYPGEVPPFKDECWCIIEAHDRSLWIGSRSGLYCKQDEKIERFQLPVELSSTFITRLRQDSHQRIWAGTRGGGVVLLEPYQKGYICRFVGLAGKTIMEIFEDHAGDIWIGTMEDGLYIIHYHDGELQCQSMMDKIPLKSVMCIHEDGFGRLWLGSREYGMYIYYPQTHQIIPFNDIYELPYQALVCFLADREGTLWIGSLTGLIALREARVHTYTTKHGLSSNHVHGIFQDNQGRIWVGTRGQGVNYFENGRFHTLTTQNGLSTNSVFAFTQDNCGSLWFGTLGGGVNRFKDGLIQPFTPATSSGEIFRFAYETGNHGLVFCTRSGDIYYQQKGQLTQAVNIDAQIITLYSDNSDSLWAGTQNKGLFRIQLQQKAFERFHWEKGLSANNVTCIHKYRKGSLWLGTDRGLFQLKNRQFSVLTTNGGLPDDKVYWILPDDNRCFWFSSNVGIYRLEGKEIEAFFNGRITKVRPILFGKEAGLKDEECTGGSHPAGCKAKDGKLWFTTTHGAAVIDPRNLAFNRQPPPVIIENLHAGNRIFSFKDPIYIHGDVESLDFHFTALSFVESSKIRFRTLLEGIDREWRDCGYQRTAHYMCPPPGKYKFRVTACNSDGVWNPQGTAVTFHVKPSFFQGSTFRLGLPLSFLVLIGFVFLFRFLHKCRSKNMTTEATKDRMIQMEPESVKEMIGQLFDLCEKDHIYRNPDLTLNSLAYKMAITPRNLSILLNDFLNIHFCDFIARYRIDEAATFLSDPNCKKPIIEIAFEVGYNSKSAFNRAFKQVTGKSPSIFRKQTMDELGIETMIQPYPESIGSPTFRKKQPSSLKKETVAG